jgi:hypothetical protein
VVFRSSTRGLHPVWSSGFRPGTSFRVRVCFPLCSCALHTAPTPHNTKQYRTTSHCTTQHNIKQHQSFAVEGAMCLVLVPWSCRTQSLQSSLLALPVFDQGPALFLHRNSLKLSPAFGTVQYRCRQAARLASNIAAGWQASTVACIICAIAHQRCPLGIRCTSAPHRNKCTVQY